MDDDGFILVSASGEQIASLKWIEVTRIEAYRSDVVIDDQICLDFETPDGTVTITEDDDGFHEMPGVLLTHYDVEDVDWFTKVMRPTFEPHRTLVYDHEAGY